MPEESSKPGRILGIGGVFFKSDDAPKLRSWYHDNLGFEGAEWGSMFPWKSIEEPATEHLTVWSIFPAAKNHFAPGSATFMINYIVDDLEALLQKLGGSGVSIDPKRDDSEYGRFAWIYDPDGNKIELWEPPSPAV